MAEKIKVPLYADGPSKSAAAAEAFDYAAGSPARFVAHLPLPGVLGPWTALGDLDGDGLPEIVTVQTAQPYNHPVMGKTGWGPKWDRIWCVTALNRAGKVIWQHGTPWTRQESYPSHAPTESGLGILDIDGDGKLEVVTHHCGTLFVYSADGALKAQREFPEQYITMSYPWAPDAGKPGLIMVELLPAKQAKGMALTLTAVDGRSLKHRWTRPGCNEMGHPPERVARPLGGEGLLIGPYLFDADGNFVWRLEAGIYPDKPEVHAASIAVGDINGDARPEIGYCIEPGDAVLVDSFSHLVGRLHMEHPHVGCIFPQTKGAPGVFLVCEHRCVHGLDAQGHALWQKAWFAYPRGSVTWGGELLVCLSPYRVAQTVPVLIDRRGAVRVRFQEILDFKHPPILSRDKKLVRGRSQDVGRTYTCVTCDWNGDGVSDIVLYDRHGLWAYAAPK